MPCRSEGVRRVSRLCDGGELVVKIELIGNPNQLVERAHCGCLVDRFDLSLAALVVLLRSSIRTCIVPARPPNEQQHLEATFVANLVGNLPSRSARPSNEQQQ